MGKGRFAMQIKKVFCLMTTVTLVFLAGCSSSNAQQAQPKDQSDQASKNDTVSGNDQVTSADGHSYQQRAAQPEQAEDKASALPWTVEWLADLPLPFLPTVARARELRRRHQCLVHLQGIGKALELYETYISDLPDGVAGLEGTGEQWKLLAESDEAILDAFQCPESFPDSTTEGDSTNSAKSDPSSDETDATRSGAESTPLEESPPAAPEESGGEEEESSCQPESR
jgi:hypothetical protein